MIILDDIKGISYGHVFGIREELIDTYKAHELRHEEKCYTVEKNTLKM